MRSRLLLGVLLVAAGQPAHAAGLLIPDDKKLPPLAMVNHKVTVAIEDQVAVTTVEQTFRNHTDRPSKRRTSSRSRRGRASTSSPCGWTARRRRANCSTRRRPARSTPTSSAAPRTRACSSTSATT